jgi:hypothetical protein
MHYKVTGASKLVVGFVCSLASYGCSQAPHKAFALRSDLCIIGRITDVERVWVLEIDTGVDYDIFSLAHNDDKEELLRFIGGPGCSANDARQLFVVRLREKSRFIDVPNVPCEAKACVPVDAELAEKMRQSGACGNR